VLWWVPAALVLVAAYCGVAIAAFAPHPASSLIRTALHGQAPTSQVIVAVGDSITYGLHDSQQPGGWVTRLAEGLRQDYPGVPFTVVNAGVNGDTAAGVLKRLDHDVLAPKLRLVILSIGTNDFDYGVPPAAFRDTLTRVITRVQTAGVLVLAVSMLPEAALQPRKLVAESAYNAIIAQVCAATGAGYLDEFRRWLALGSAELKRLRDAAEHPNPLGYRLLATGMAAFLETQYFSLVGRIVQPPERPTSDLLPESLDTRAPWQAVAVQTLPHTRLSVAITATNGLGASAIGRACRVRRHTLKNGASHALE